MRELNFRLPDPEPPQPGWGAVGVAAHAIVIALLVGTVGRSVVEKTATFLDLGGSMEGAREFVLPPLSESVVLTPGSASEPVLEAADTASGYTVIVAPRVIPIGVPPRLPTLSEYDPVVGSAPVIGVSRGTGNLWVGPLEGRLGVVGPSPDMATHVARVDSAVKAIVLAYIDSMPADSFATPPMASPWVTETEDGKTWGVDPGWIYLGDFKLPSALLALLPLPQGNIDLARGEAELMRIRQEIMVAARQAQANADINRYIKEIRKRKDAERQARLAAEAARKGVKKDTIKPTPGL
ncbi:MAG: hypothetical protein JSW71_21555 [Gemmatimonadota bacterium]|nr:MAG: hypothetical protein JSW71_21555 [Gemmatimonadota bacterium]